jgi:hypothetical protein
MHQETVINKYVCWAVAAMLLVAVFPLPYGYYTLVRIVCTTFFGYLAYVNFALSRPMLASSCVLFSILFQPLIKVYFVKEIWGFVDVIAGIFALYLGVQIDKLRGDSES